MPKKIKIIIAEDHAMVRDAIKVFLEKISDFSVIGDVENGQKLIELLEAKTPDVILLDHQMPVMDGLIALKIIKFKYPQVKVVIITSHNDAKLQAFYFTNGANAYLLKNEDGKVLKRAIVEVHQNGYYLGNSSSKSVMEELKSMASKKENIAVHFTEKEIEVLKSMYFGWPNKTIADKLNITEKTVDFHKGNMYKKTHIHSHTGLVIYAISLGIIDERDVN